MKNINVKKNIHSNLKKKNHKKKTKKIKFIPTYSPSKNPAYKSTKLVHTFLDRRKGNKSITFFKPIK